jgi:hypothetical protein
MRRRNVKLKRKMFLSTKRFRNKKRKAYQNCHPSMVKEQGQMSKS